MDGVGGDPVFLQGPGGLPYDLQGRVLPGLGDVEQDLVPPPGDGVAHRLQVNAREVGGPVDGLDLAVVIVDDGGLYDRGAEDVPAR